MDDHDETWRLRSGGFKSWLARQYYEREGAIPRAGAIQDALTTLEGLARFDGPELMVHLRHAHVGDVLYIDLGDFGWRVIEVTAAGWRILDESPVKFRRPRGMLALPEPIRQPGGLDQLRDLLNITDDAWCLVVGYLLGCYSPGPYPVLVATSMVASLASTDLTRGRPVDVEPAARRRRAGPRARLLGGRTERHGPYRLPTMSETLMGVIGMGARFRNDAKIPGCILGAGVGVGSGPERDLVRAEHWHGHPFWSLGDARSHAAVCNSYGVVLEAWLRGAAEAREKERRRDIPGTTMPGCPVGQSHPTAAVRAEHGDGRPFASIAHAHAHADICRDLFWLPAYVMFCEPDPAARTSHPFAAWQRYLDRQAHAGQRRPSGYTGYTGVTRGRFRDTW